MKALILRLNAFKGRKEATKNKTFLSVDLFDLETNKTYTGLMADVSRCPLPDGQIPEPVFFPAVADVEFSFGSMKDGSYRPFLNGVTSWESLEIPGLK